MHGQERSKADNAVLRQYSLCGSCAFAAADYTLEPYAVERSSTHVAMQTQLLLCAQLQ